MIRIVCWSFMTGMMMIILLKKGEDVDALGICLLVGAAVMVVIAFRDVVTKYNITDEDLW